MLPLKSHASLKVGPKAHEGGGDVEDRIRRYRRYPVAHVNYDDASTNVRSMRSAIIDGLQNG